MPIRKAVVLAEGRWRGPERTGRWAQRGTAGRPTSRRMVKLGQELPNSVNVDPECLSRAILPPVARLGANSTATKRNCVSSNDRNSVHSTISAGAAGPPDRCTGP
jgi:hypothetical protein